MGIDLNAIGIECFARARPPNNWRSSDEWISSICGDCGQEISKKEKSFSTGPVVCDHLGLVKLGEQLNYSCVEGPWV